MQAEGLDEGGFARRRAPRDADADGLPGLRQRAPPSIADRARSASRVDSMRVMAFADRARSPARQTRRTAASTSEAAGDWPRSPNIRPWPRALAGSSPAPRRAATGSACRARRSPRRRLAQEVVVLRRDDAADEDDDVLRARSLSAFTSSGTSVLWPAASVDTPMACTSFSMACARPPPASGRAGRRRCRSRVGEGVATTFMRRGRGRPGRAWRPGCAGGAPARGGEGSAHRAISSIRRRRC
jgi:hypothetical protein